MINLSLGENTVALTPKESTPSGYLTDSYLFKFFSHATNNTLYFLAQVQNINEDERFSQFTITLVETEAEEGLNFGTIYLPNTGFLEYTIYAQLEVNLAPQPTDIIVEQGRVLYEFNESTITSYSPDIETIVYNG